VRFRIDVNNQGNTWQVEITNVTTGNALLDSEGHSLKRTLESVGDQLSTFPQPPHEETEKIPDTPDNPHRELCVTKDPQVIKEVYDKYVRRDGEDVVKFGRYLFATLLGANVWKAINDTAGNEPVELALTWKDDYLINRLPWEMMHNGQRFLAEEPEVAITRRVAESTQTLTELTMPRVLFVVGSALNEKLIKPGAEYLSLLRSLTLGARRRLKTHLLLDASPKRLKAAVELFRPTVVHFICHGFATVEQETFLQLRSDDGNGEESVTAEALLRLLKPKAGYHLPQVVILNACYTASELYTKSGQAASPIAARLVAGDGVDPGVPIVVGMAGEIADQACRLFTRCFYQALLEGREVSHAAADGRRMGIIEDGLTDPKTSIDWALPTLFMSAAVDKAEIVVQPSKAEEQWYDAASEIAPSEYPVFCDRLRFFEWYDCLMVDDLPAPQRFDGELQLLAVSLREKNARFAKSKLGLTWLLQQFASNAALDGHLPVLVSTALIGREKQQYPSDYPRLIEDFKKAIIRTTQRFDLDFTSDYLNLIDDLTEFSKSGKSRNEMPDQLKKAVEQLPRDLHNAFSEDKQWDGPQVQFTALRCDLLKLLELGRKKVEPEGVPKEEKKLRPKLLLLVDDVHQMDKATRHLLQHFFSSPYGLRSTAVLSEGGPSAKRDIRVICTYDLSMGLGEENTIISWLETAKGVKEVPLGAFQEPEDRLAYQFFISRWQDKNKVEKPLAVSHRADPQFVQVFFDSLHEEVEGIPERLKSEGASAVINTHLKLQTLRAINDEDRLRLISQMRRN